MDKNKLIKLFEFMKNNKNKKPETSWASCSFHTNPIIQRMFFGNMLNKKDKFTFKDLFR